MKKKDFELIASVVKSFNDKMNNYTFSSKLFTIKDFTKQLCETLASKNPRFDKQKFLQACGVEIHVHVWQETKIIKKDNTILLCCYCGHTK